MLIVRPSRTGELDTLRSLARQSGPGFTSLPDDDRLLSARLERSHASFASAPKAPSEEAYLLMLEDTATGEVVGCAGVKAAVGVAKPFFSFRRLTIAQASAAAQRRFDMEVLVLVNEFPGCTEVGSLFVNAAGRGGGAGRLLAQARYLLMAAGPQRFADMVIAELRGQVDEAGASAFWDEIGAKFFHMSFDQADYLSAVSDNQFIVDLMPKYPIYVDLLSDRAQAAIGAVHPDGMGAQRLLEWEGFRGQAVVDIFDGGPLLSSPRERIRTARESKRVRVRLGAVGDEAREGLVSTDRFPDFRVARASLRQDGDSVTLPSEVGDALALKEGDAARVWISS